MHLRRLKAVLKAAIWSAQGQRGLREALGASSLWFDFLDLADVLASSYPGSSCYVSCSVSTEGEAKAVAAHLCAHDAFHVGGVSKLGGDQGTGGVCKPLAHRHLLNLLAQHLGHEVCQALQLLYLLLRLQVPHKQREQPPKQLQRKLKQF